MKITTSISLGLALLLYAGHAKLDACPYCNIHNCLIGTVNKSTNIFLGKIIRQYGNNTAQAKVLRPIYGQYKSGQIVEVPSYRNQNIKECLFFDANEINTYHSLAPEFESEVLFLVRLRQLGTNGLNRYPVKDATEAIEILQGLSNHSRAVGFRFLGLQKTPPTQQIISAIETIRNDRRIQQTGYDNGYKLTSLIEGLLIHANPDVEQYLLTQIKDLPRRNSSEISWSKKHYDLSLELLPPTPQTVLLASIMGFCRDDWQARRWTFYENPFRKSNPILFNKLHDEILKIYPQLEGLALAEATFALCDAGMETPKSLFYRIQNVTPKKDAFALGILWAVKRKLDWAEWIRAENTMGGKDKQEKAKADAKLKAQEAQLDMTWTIPIISRRSLIESFNETRSAPQLKF